MAEVLLTRPGATLARRQKPSERIPKNALGGQVVETVGRRVRVRDADGDRVCFLSGQRAVVGDQVWWVEAKGTGGKLVGVQDRDTVFSRRDLQGKEKILAANIEGLVVVCTPSQPEFRAGLIDRYSVAASSAGLEIVICLNKVDLPIDDTVREALDIRKSVGTTVIQTSAKTNLGLDELSSFLSEQGQERPWALVGHSGVGKTSLIQALLPSEEVGRVGELSSYWGTGQHTTTQSRLFVLSGGGKIVDSPGIRTFSPGRLTSAEMRDNFWGVGRLNCHYRDCLHRQDEKGCEAPTVVIGELLTSYRRLLAELLVFEER
jgi:ribosome biogenesis GTPase